MIANKIIEYGEECVLFKLFGKLLKHLEYLIKLLAINAILEFSLEWEFSKILLLYKTNKKKFQERICIFFCDNTFAIIFYNFADLFNAYIL